MRCDSTFDRRITAEELQEVERHINQYSEEGHQLEVIEVPLSEAQKTQALRLEDFDYPDPVTIYRFGTISQEFCGGPHVSNTKDIGGIEIIKEEAVGQGIRRIRARLTS